MEGNKLTYSEAKNVSITAYLYTLGIQPAKMRGNDWWYHSPFRQERTPSFKVNNKLNLWYDHGIGEGGTILDLGAKLHGWTVSEFLRNLTGEVLRLAPLRERPTIKEFPQSKVEIVSANPLVDQTLLQYLKSRGIDVDIARRYCKEVDFKIKNANYKAIGFANQSGGFELRNKWFKGGSSPKDISLIVGLPGTIAVFEGFMDFLSLLQMSMEDGKHDPEHTSLILNSANMVSRALPIVAQTHSKVILFLHNDPTGRKAKDHFEENGLPFQDASPLYAEFKDLNEWLMARKGKGTPIRSKSKHPNLG